MTSRRFGGFAAAADDRRRRRGGAPQPHPIPSTPSSRAPKRAPRRNKFLTAFRPDRRMRAVLIALACSLGAALVPVSLPKTRAVSMKSSVTEAGTSVLEDTEGLGAEFEDAIVDDEAWDVEGSGDEDLLAGFDLDGADVGDIDSYGATPREICDGERAEYKAKFPRHDNDCGSSEIQIALFTARIKHITQHVVDNPKDHASRRGLLTLVSKRRRLLNYYHSRSPEKAVKLAADLGVRFRFKSALPDRAEKYRQYTIAANKKKK